MTEVRRRNKKRKNQSGVIAVLITLMLMIVLSTALLFLPEQEDKKKDRPKVTPTVTPNAEVNTAVSEYEQLAVVLDVDTEIRLLTVHNIESGEEEKLVYTGASKFYDGYGVQISAAQLVKGSLFRFTIDEKEEWISTAVEAVNRSENNKNDGVWEKTGIEYLTVMEDKIIFRNQNYRYSDAICVMSNGKRISLEDLESGVDILTVRGQGQQIYEIVVTKGHGYITLENQEDFIGGVITIGNTRVDTIAEDSVYLVREGTYEVSVECGEYKGTEDITVGRDATAVFDVFEYGHGPVKTCWITVSVDPLGATLYVDGEKTYYTDGFELDYGTYEFEFTEGGYTSYKATVQVNQPKQTVSAFLTEQHSNIMEEEDDDTTRDPGEVENNDTTDDETNDDETNDGMDDENADTPAVQTSVSIAKYSQYELNMNNAIYILGPVGAQVYLDEYYLGTAPINFEKIIGSYLITIIRADGTPEIHNAAETDNGQDVYYNFGE